MLEREQPAGFVILRKQLHTTVPARCIVELIWITIDFQEAVGCRAAWREFGVWVDV
jgi:hypothetical protein